MRGSRQEEGRGGTYAIRWVLEVEPDFSCREQDMVSGFEEVLVYRRAEPFELLLVVAILMDNLHLLDDGRLA